MKLLKYSFLLLLAVVSFQSCKTAKQNLKSSDLTGKWILKSLDGQSTETLFPGKKPTLELNLTNSTVFGNAGCNNYSGAFTYIDNVFSTSKVAVTLMACLDGTNESLFLKALGDPMNLSVKNGELSLLKDNKVVMAFEKAKPITAADLTGVWTLTVLQGATANVDFKNRIPTMIFNFENGKVSGNTGCNSYNGKVELTDNRLSIGSLATTRRACVDGMEGEKKFVSAIPGDSDIELSNGQLVLKRGGLRIATFVKEK